MSFPLFFLFLRCVLQRELVFITHLSYLHVLYKYLISLSIVDMIMTPGTFLAAAKTRASKIPCPQHHRVEQVKGRLSMHSLPLFLFLCLRWARKEALRKKNKNCDPLLAYFLQLFLEPPFVFLHDEEREQKANPWRSDSKKIMSTMQTNKRSWLRIPPFLTMQLSCVWGRMKGGDMGVSILDIEMP